MADAGKIASTLLNPMKLADALMARWANFLVKGQVARKFNSPEVRRFDRGHYAWNTMDDPFVYGVFCIQETNLVDFVKSCVPEEGIGTVIELGSASPLFLNEVKAKKKIGINVLPECVEQLNKAGVEGRLSTGKTIPAEEGEADMIICLQTFEHVPDPIGFARDLAKVLKDDGILVMSVPWVESTVVRDKFYGQEKPNQPESEYHIFEYSPEDFKKVVSHAGLESVREETLHNYRLCYDPLSNYIIRKKYALHYFPAVQAFKLRKRVR